MFELMDKGNELPVIKVIGVGGGGRNAVNHISEQGVFGLHLYAVNTDAKSLQNIKGVKTLTIGEKITGGLGAGGNPDAGKGAALESYLEIEKLLNGADLVILLVGMGGGTGTGASPVIANIAKKLGILTIAITSQPFPFEGKKRISIAKQGIKKLNAKTDAIISLDCETLLHELGSEPRLLDAFNALNKKISNITTSLTGLITRPGLINIDLLDVKILFTNAGFSSYASAVSKGENRASKAAHEAIKSAFSSDINKKSCQGVLVNITAGLDMSIGEFERVGQEIRGFISGDVAIVLGTVINEELTNSMQVSVFVTGIKENNSDKLRNTTIEHRAKDERLPSNKEFLDIPAFLRKATEKTANEVSMSGINIVTSVTMSDEDIVELISHLSNVYKSVGGDELVVDCVKNIPPNSNVNKGIFSSLRSAFR